MKPKYRVEAFIVPKSMCVEEKLNSSNVIDDVKAANKLKIVESEFSQDDSIDDLKLKLIDDDDDEAIDEPIYDIPYSSLPRFSKIRENSKSPNCETFSLPKIPVRTSSLMSIDERGETDGILEEFCFHGYKNGCTAPAQRPEEVSEEIFKENWLRRLESLRERESRVRDKETLLQERERLLFKKERELRILERLIKDKLKQADFYLKRCQSYQSIESASNFDVKTRSSEGSREFSTNGSKNSLINRQNNVQRSEDDFFNVPLKIIDPLRYSREETKCLALKAPEMKQSMSSLKSSGSSCDEKTLKNPPNSRSSLLTASNINAKSQMIKNPVESSNLNGKSTFGGFSGYGSSLRCKPRPKISYDDLDSTLSADIGDSSFVVTSGKFDPTIFKKPQAFTRSASERRAKNDQEKISICKSQENQNQIRGNFTEDKVLKRLCENIHISQDKNTKFLDYGLIDPKINVEKEKSRCSYLNLERGEERKNSISRKIKERPISWNEETNAWLQKKRQAYNLANKRIPNENFDKENTEDCYGKRDKTTKLAKNKETKAKKFAIFR